MSTSNQKKTTTKKRASSSRKGRSRKKAKDFSSFHTEVAIWITIAFSLLLMLGNFGLCGNFGRVLGSIFFGTFGFMQYFVPLIILLLIGLLLANQFSTLAVKKSLLVILLFCMFSTISQMIVDFGCTSAFKAAGYSFLNHTGGGAVGGGICIFLHKLFGKAGAVLVVAIVSIISLMLIFEKSVFKLMQQLGNYAAEFSRQRKLRRKERQKLLEEERKKEEEKKKEKEKEEELERTLDNCSPEGEEADSSVAGAFVEFHDHIIKDDLNSKKIRNKFVDLGKKFGLDMEFHTPGKSGDDEPREKETKETSDMPTINRLSDSLMELVRKAEEDLEDQKVQGQKRGKTFLFSNDLDSHFDGEGTQDTGTFVESGEKENAGLILGAGEISAPNTASLGDGKQNAGQAFKAKEENPSEVPNEPGRSTESATEAMAKEMPGSETVLKLENGKKEEGKKRNSPPAFHPETAEEIREDIDGALTAEEEPYVFPPLNLLAKGEKGNFNKQRKLLRETAIKLQNTLANFGVNVSIKNISCGPSVTRYELQPEQGVKVSKIVGLADDIKLNLATPDIRIEAPIPGKAAVGIEVPNRHVDVVKFRDLIDGDDFRNFPSKLAFAVGKDIGGKIIISDIAKMPHLLIAGATGSGKSVCINTLIMSILYKAKPDEVKFIMIDPKVVELNTYNGIPHLLIPVVTDPQKAAGALNWAVEEMQDRYQKFAQYNVRNLEGYNKKVKEVLAASGKDGGEKKKLSQIIIIVDELADLMMAAPGEVESAIVRLSQLARAAGIHLVIATQRPSVNVITGLIKANVPSRIAFAVSSGVDSRTIIDMNGAEKLLGRGDMLFYPQGQQKPVRVQGAFISDNEVGAVVDFLKQQSGEEKKSQAVSDEVENKIESSIHLAAHSDDRDEYFEEAARFIISKDKASIGMIQRMFKVGFNRASRIMEQLAEAGIVGPEEGTKPRKILMSPEQLEQYLKETP